MIPLVVANQTRCRNDNAPMLFEQMGLVAPDTSPRGASIPGESNSWDFGLGAGFYLDATAAPWAENYRMYSYVSKELPSVIAEHFPTLDLGRYVILW